MTGCVLNREETCALFDLIKYVLFRDVSRTFTWNRRNEEFLKRSFSLRHCLKLNEIY